MYRISEGLVIYRILDNSVIVIRESALVASGIAYGCDLPSGWARALSTSDNKSKDTYGIISSVSQMRETDDDILLSLLEIR